MSMTLEDSPIKSTHIHEYERSKTSKEIYRCVHPDCSHYQRREYLEGKKSICSKCKSIFILSWAQLRNKYPVCDFCTKSPKSKELKEARDLAQKALNELTQDLPEDLKKSLNRSMQEINEKEKDENNTI